MGSSKWRGKKTGVGFYMYEEGSKGPKRTGVNPHLTAGASANGSFDADTIVDRCVLTMVNEAARCLAEKIVASSDELDLAMVFGTGFAPFRGGLWKYAETRGLGPIRMRLEELTARFGPRFKPADSLK